jgi:hypothetical protein
MPSVSGTGIALIRWVGTPGAQLRADPTLLVHKGMVVNIS